MITALGTARRMRAMAAIGHPDADVATWLGIDVAAVPTLQAEGSTNRAMMGRVTKLCERIGVQVGRCALTRQRAHQAGWCTFLAWDAIDDPDAVPCGPQQPADVAEAAADQLIRRLADQGWTDPDIAAHLRVSRNSVLRRRTALGIPAADTAQVRVRGHDGRWVPSAAAS